MALWPRIRMAYYLYIRDPKYNNRDYLAKDYLTGEGLDNLLIDERRDDGIDNDGDWDYKTDDLGMDGKSGSGDTGEGDGLPTAAVGDLPGEPNVDRTDVDESDQIGLTSFIFYEYGNVTYSNDAQMWDVSGPGYFDGHLENVDADYIFSCGYFPLTPGKDESFSVAMVYGEDQEDILRNKDIVQKIYNSNYNFAVAPEKPLVRAVVGDQKVTLYWDARAEESVDRYLHEYDFEGYKIYRATDPGFKDAAASAMVMAIHASSSRSRSTTKSTASSDFSRKPSAPASSITWVTRPDWCTPSSIRPLSMASAISTPSQLMTAAILKRTSRLPRPTCSSLSMPRAIVRTGENVVAVIPQAPALGYVAPAPGRAAASGRHRQDLRPGECTLY